MLDSRIIQILALHFIEGLSALEIFDKLEDELLSNTQQSIGFNEGVCDEVTPIDYQTIIRRCNNLVDKNIAETYINKDNIKIYKLVSGIS